MTIKAAPISESATSLSIACLVSGQGRGSNVGALLHACAEGRIKGHISVVVGTRADAPALERAREAGVGVAVISPKKYEDDEAGYADALMRVLAKHKVGLICLAGYMRKLPPAVIASYTNQIMNVHPALLPLFGGRGMYGEHVHQAVLDSGMKVTGSTVHFVDEHYDNGPIIVQEPVMVQEDDTPASLSARVLPAEHRAYVQAVSLFAEGRLRVEGRRVAVAPANR